MSGRYYRFIDKNIAPLKIKHLAVAVNGKKMQAEYQNRNNISVKH